jgi:outer membrane receptor for ferrienterochelin and colicins
MNPLGGSLFNFNSRLGISPKTIRCVLILLFFFVTILANSAETATNQVSQDLTELSLEELMQKEFADPTVFSASKIEQKSTEAPASVTIINSQEIKRYGYRTLADVLQSVQGFHISYDRNYSFLGTRGVSLGDFNGRILLLVDGHRVNNNLTDGAFIGTEFILDVDLIERVEIIRGPGSVLYGNNAFFGVINVITRNGKSVNGAEVSGEYATFDTWKGRASIGKSFTNGVEFLLSGTLYDSQGDDRLFYEEFNTPAQNNGVAEDLDNDSFGSFFGSVRYSDFTLEGGFIEREKRNPTAPGVGANGFNDPRLRSIDERSYVNLKYAHSFQDVVDVTAQVYYDRNEFKIGYPFGTNLIKEHDVGEWWGTDLQLTKRLWEQHIITVGAEYRDDFRQERTTPPEADQERQSYGVYLQGDFAIQTNLHFNGGVRYDQYGDFDSEFSPRLAMIYNPVESSTLKAIYGTAFRTPNFLELALSQPGQLSPEEITSYELIYEQEVGRNFRSSLSGFYNQMDELIIFQNGFTNFDANSKGVEFALATHWSNGISGRASYTFQKTENRSTDSRLPDSPQHLLKFNLSVPLYKEKIFAGLEYQYTSSRRTVFATPLGTTLRGADTAGFGVVNLTLFSQNLIKDLEFSASIYNLFDKQYGDPSTRSHEQDIIERDGRSFRVKLTYRF